MKHLLGVEKIGNRVNRDWLHTGDSGRTQITVQTVEDVEPVIESVKRTRDMPDTPIGRVVARIPATVVMEAAKINAQYWGVSVHDAYREIANDKTDRAHRVWSTLVKGRDYSKFQTKG